MNHGPHMAGDGFHELETCRQVLEIMGNGARVRGAGVADASADFRHPQKIARQICDLLGSSPLHKDRVHVLRSELARYGVQLSERRARGIYNGEVARLWHDERVALETAHDRLQSAKRASAYIEVAGDISRKLAAAGCPLTHMQERVISSVLH